MGRLTAFVAGDATAAPVAIQFGWADAVLESKLAIIETNREHVEPGETSDLVGQRVLMRSGRTSALIHVNAGLLGLSYVTNDRQSADVVLRSAEHWRSYGTCASDPSSFHALAGLGARLLVSAGGTAVALLPLVRQFRSFLWHEPGPFGATGALKRVVRLPQDDTRGPGKSLQRLSFGANANRDLRVPPLRPASRVAGERACRASSLVVRQEESKMGPHFRCTGHYQPQFLRPDEVIHEIQVDNQCAQPIQYGLQRDQPCLNYESWTDRC